jgi:hypothetical protein
MNSELSMAYEPTRAKIINKELKSYGKEVTILRKVNRWNYLIEFTPDGKTFYMNVDNLQLLNSL